MEIKIKNKDLLGPLSIVAGVAEEKTTMPILGYLRYRTQNNRMTLVGTDGEVEITSHLTLANESPDMEGTIPARKFLNICRSFDTDSEMIISYENEKMHLKKGDSIFELSTLPAEDFPMMAVPEGEDKKLRFSLPASELRQRMISILSCMPVNDVRYYLNGMLFDFSSDKLSLVTTDGHRMGLTTKKIDAAADEKIKCIVPREGVLQLMRLIGGQSEEVELVFYSNMVQVITKDFAFNCKLIDATFPDYARVIPADQQNVLTVEQGLLYSSLQRCTYLMTGAANKLQKAEFSIEGDKVYVRASNMEGEKVEETLPIEYTGTNLEINFNIQYILDVVATMNESKVSMSLTDGNSSAVFRKQGAEDTLFVVMPMKV